MTDQTLSYNISGQQAADFRGKMLEWYDRHGRTTIPWRAPKGQIPDPYHVWLSEIMCQQTTVQAVAPYFIKFVSLWPRVSDLANAPREDVMREWAGLGYYARARNLHECAKIIAFEHNGVFPSAKDELMKLPGIGDYTGAAIAAIAFNRCETVVDGNVERVMARYCAVETPLPKAKKELKALAAQFFTGEARAGDFAQSLMDLGAGICTPKSPKCVLCPVMNGCAARKGGLPETYPKRAPKAQRPQKEGLVYWIEDGQGNLLLERRDDKAMMGGMLGLPTSEWLEKAVNKTFEAPEKLEALPLSTLSERGQVRHVFTHFELTLTLMAGSAARTALNDNDGRYFWAERADIKPESFPTLFKKAVLLALN